MKLSGIKHPATRYGGKDSAHDAVAAPLPAESRALVPVHAAIQRDLNAKPRSAAFLAQLIAAKEQVPQARDRRRAEPSDAMHAYQAAMNAVPYTGGKVVSRQT
ncbi:MAG: hypothetical protein JO245_10575 [Pseudolabrys sp.]|nr:hypothetical protein [Pseudolabrys sp.]